MNGNNFYLKLDLVEGHVFSAKIDERVWFDTKDIVIST